MNRTQLARVFLVLGTILVSASSLLLVGFVGPDIAHASEVISSPKPDKTYKLGPMDPSQTCEARYITASANPSYILASDCNRYNSQNHSKVCLRCNGKYMMKMVTNDPPGGPGVGSPISVSCGYVETSACTVNEDTYACDPYYTVSTTTDCGNVTEYSSQAYPIEDPPL